MITKVSDPELAEVWSKPRDEEGIQLTLRTTDGKEATCRPHAGESRKFHSTFGIGAGSPLGRCGLAFRGLHSDLPDYTLQPTSCTTSSEPPAGSCDCGIAEWDWRCHDPSSDPLGGLGCMGCGVQECRLEDLFCVFFPHTFTHCTTFKYIISLHMQGLRCRPLPTVHWDQRRWSDDNQCHRLDNDRD